MAKEPERVSTPSLELTAEEVALVESYRVLRIGIAEALQRLATPLSSPLLPVGQELQANMPVPTETLIIPHTGDDREREPS